MPVPSVSPEDIFVSVLDPLVADLLKWENQLGAFNTLPNIDWHLREKMRTYEGKIGGLHQSIVEDFDRLDTPNGRAAVEKFWGPLEDE
jgi:hypothetical protein